MKYLSVILFVIVSTIVGTIESASTEVTTAKSSVSSSTARTIPTTTSGRTVPPTTTGRTSPPTTSGRTSPPTTTGRTSPPTTTGRTVPPTTTGRTSPPTTTGRTSPPTTTGRTVPTTTSGRTLPPTTTARISTSKTTSRTVTPMTTKYSSTWRPGTINCYHCEYGYCPEPFSSSSPNVNTVYATSGWCVKISNTNSRNDIYSRGAASNGLCSSSGCSWKTEGFIRRWVCCCKGNYCNTAISISKSSITLLFSTLLLVFILGKSI